MSKLEGQPTNSELLVDLRKLVERVVPTSEDTVVLYFPESIKDALKAKLDLVEQRLPNNNG